MQKFNPFKASFRAMAMAGALCIPGLLFAGNIRQYSFQKSRDGEYEELKDADQIEISQWAAQSLILPGGDITVAGGDFDGFPIGFDFRFGGQVFNEFLISNTGWILLGNNGVHFNGFAGGVFNGLAPNIVDGFYLGIMPTKGGTYSQGLDYDPKRSGTISYKTEGEEGNRVLTVQFSNLRLNETNNHWQSMGVFSLQIRLYEADGKVQYAFQEEDTTYSSGYGFFVGLHGWDQSDTMLITATGLNKAASISPKRWGNILEPDTQVLWDDADAGNSYHPVWNFTPAQKTGAPAQAPSDLKVVQDGNSITVSCKKASDAAATMILMSNSPIPDTDVPVDGTTYGVKIDNDGNYSTMIGSSALAFYDDLDECSFTLDDVNVGQNFYFKAISVNGYPEYNTTNTADLAYVTPQAAPGWARAENSEDQKETTISWNSEFPVIVAKTYELPDYAKNYEGKFGQPAYNAQVGDMIDGGGEVIYAGTDSSVSFTFEEENRPVYFKVWTVDGTVVSATGTDAAAVPAATFPYNPNVESWPQAINPLGWYNNDNNLGFFPAILDYQHRPALRGFSGDRAMTICHTPAFPAATDAVLKFGWGMETQRPPEEDPETGIMMLKGYRAGYFGPEVADIPTQEDNLGLYVYLTNPETQERRLLQYFSKYDGQMVEFSPDNYNDESASFEPVEIQIGDIPEGHVIELQFASVVTSRLFINNFSVEAKTQDEPVTPPVVTPAADPTELTAAFDQETETITATAVKGENAKGTLMVISTETPDAAPVDNSEYKAGDELGNATVIYFGEDAEIKAEVVKNENGKYIITAWSYDEEGKFNTTSVATTVDVEVSGIAEILNDIENVEIYNVAGLRLQVNSINELPAGIYIMNGKKIIIR